MCKDDEWIIDDLNDKNVQTEVNVEKDDVVVYNVMEVDLVVTDVMQSGGSGVNIELGGSGTLSDPTLVNDEKDVSSRTKFDDDTQYTDDDNGDYIGGYDFT